MARVKSTPRRWATRKKFLMVSKRRFARGTKRTVPPLQRQAKRARLDIGLSRPPAQLSKTRTTAFAVNTARSSRTLNTWTITDIPFGTGINERQRNEVKIRGFRLRFYVRNNIIDQQTFRIAILSPKNNQIVLNDNFFKGYDTEKALDFSTTRTGLELVASGINTRDFNILWHKSFNLAPTDSTHRYNQANTSKYIKTYIPLKRTLLWDSPADAEPSSDRCFLVYWCDRNLNISGAAPTGSAFIESFDVVTYYDDAN